MHQISASALYSVGSLSDCGLVTKSDGSPILIIGRNTTAGGVSILTDFETGTATVDDTASSNDIFGTDTWASYAAAIDSNDVIHILAMAQTNLSGNEIRYATATESGGTYTIGTFETAGYYEDYDTGLQFYCDIAVDSNDKPHAVYISDVTQAGSTQQQVMYVEKTGASWSTPAQLSTRATKTYAYSGCRIDIWNNGTADVIEVAYVQYLDLTNDPYVYQTKVGTGSWSGENTWSSYYVESIPRPHMVVDSSNNVYRYAGTYAISSPSNYIENDVDTGIDSPGDISITNPGKLYPCMIDNVRYLIFQDPTPDYSQIQYSYYTGSGWSTPADAMDDLAFSPDGMIVPKSSSLNYVDSGGIHIILEDTSNVYYHFFSLATDTSDNQPAYLRGGIEATPDNQPAYLEGTGGQLVGLQPGVIELTGSVTPGVDQIIQLQPGVIELSGRIISPTSPNAGSFDNWLNNYTPIDGIPGVSYDDGMDIWLNATTPLKTKIKDKKPKKVDISLGAGVVAIDAQAINVATNAIDSQSAFLDAVGGVTDSCPAYLIGATNTLDNQPAYMLAIGEWLVPDGDISQSGSWKRENESATDLYLSILETDPNDSNYVYHVDVTGSEYFEVTLSDPSWVNMDAGDVIIYWRGERLEGTNSTDIRCELREGTNVIASDTQTFTDSPVTHALTLTAPQKASVTDWTNLRLRFVVESVT